MMETIVFVLLMGAIISGFALLAIVLWLIGVFNQWKTALQNIKESWSNILTEYQRRADLFFNLSKSVKGSAKFETETLAQVTAARSGSFGNNAAEQMKNLKGLDQMFSKIMATWEAYPELKSPRLFEKLMEEVRVSEDRINAARTDYNDIVGDYNTYITTFPTNLLCGLYKMKVAEFFKNEEYSKKRPVVEV